MSRMLLICLLALALPAQGVMAGTLAFCGPNDHDRATVATVGHDADPTQHDLAAHSHHEAADKQAKNTASADSASDETAQPGAQKCSVCASCCSAAAICDTVPKLPALESMAADFAALTYSVEPFAADGPERPPRRLLA